MDTGHGYVEPGADVAEGVAIAPGAVIYAGARIGAGSRIGAGAVVHGRTEVGERCLIEDGAVLGKRPRLRAASSAAGAEIGALVLEADVTVCSGAVVYAGAHIATTAIIGDQAQVRERATVGAGSVVGRASSVDFEAHIGARVLIQTGVYVTGGSVVEDDVFLGPGVLTTNDHTMGRHPAGEHLLGPTFRRACRVGGGAVLVPGIVIGEEAFVAAGALVTRDVGAREVVMGAPARVVRRVPDEDLIERWS
jgi:UDP-2-acetamido-3-amino-2,3-dideoxy-glucuronate N-acetyltransferase